MIHKIIRSSANSEHLSLLSVPCTCHQPTVAKTVAVINMERLKQNPNRKVLETELQPVVEQQPNILIQAMQSELLSENDKRIKSRPNFPEPTVSRKNHGEE